MCAKSESCTQDVVDVDASSVQSPECEASCTPDLLRQVYQSSFGTRQVDYAPKTSPLIPLPSELLLHIFDLALDLPVRSSLIDTWKFPPDESPLWILMLVCKRWHRLILASPNLWSRVTVVIGPGKFAQESYLHRLRRQIALSGQIALDVCVAEHSGHHLMLPPRIYAMLKPIAPRIRELHLFLPLTNIFGLHSLRPRFRALTKLYIHNLTPEEKSKDLDSIHIFDNASKLCSYTTVDVQDPRRASGCSGPGSRNFLRDTAGRLLLPGMH